MATTDEPVRSFSAMMASWMSERVVMVGATTGKIEIFDQQPVFVLQPKKSTGCFPIVEILPSCTQTRRLLQCRGQVERRARLSIQQDATCDCSKEADAARRERMGLLTRNLLGRDVASSFVVSRRPIILRGMMSYVAVFAIGLLSLFRPELGRSNCTENLDKR
jgi:hypothetical protein